jgi:soluble lytic murein transglycosylase
MAMRRWFPWLLAALVLLAVALGDWLYLRWRDHRYDPLIRLAAQQYGVDPSLVKAVIWKESNFKATARGQAGEIGLMQMRELAAVEWSSAEKVGSFEMEHLTDPGTNTLAGTWYLARLLRRYRHTDDPVPYALADFNAGRSHVLKWIKGNGAETNSTTFVSQIGFPSTRRYVELILVRRLRYQGDFRGLQVNTPH